MVYAARGLKHAVCSAAAAAGTSNARGRGWTRHWRRARQRSRRQLAAPDYWQPRSSPTAGRAHTEHRAPQALSHGAATYSARVMLDEQLTGWHLLERHDPRRRRDADCLGVSRSQPWRAPSRRAQRRDVARTSCAPTGTARNRGRRRVGVHAARRSGGASATAGHGGMTPLAPELLDELAAARRRARTSPSSRRSCAPRATARGRSGCVGHIETCDGRRAPAGVEHAHRARRHPAQGVREPPRGRLPAVRGALPPGRLPPDQRRPAGRQGRPGHRRRAPRGVRHLDGAELRARAHARARPGRAAAALPAAPRRAGLPARRAGSPARAVHAEDDPCLGEPLCPECFDHEGAVVWNNLLGELWRRTTIYLPRTLAR